jgi:hypothetical protein
MITTLDRHQIPTILFIFLIISRLRITYALFDSSAGKL